MPSGNGSSGSLAAYRRPTIEYNTYTGKFTHNGQPVRIVLRKGSISVGCSDISPEAAREILKLYDRTFCDEVVVQP